MKFKDSELTFNENNIWCEKFNFHVMSDWERPMMKAHADLFIDKEDILEIGFGMGISANYIQEHNPKTHTIVECHPQVLEKLYEWAKDKPSVIIIEGEWGKVTDQFTSYDGIFYDAEQDEALRKISTLMNYLKEDGIFTYFNPYGKHLSKNFKSLTVEYKKIGGLTPPKNQYFNSDTYYLPIVKNS